MSTVKRKAVPGTSKTDSEDAVARSLGSRGTAAGAAAEPVPASVSVAKRQRVADSPTSVAVVPDMRPALRKAQSEASASTRRGTATKMVVNLRKEKPKLPEDFEQQTWQTLSDAVNAVHHATATSSRNEELLNAVQTLCLHNFAETLFQQLRDQCTEHIQSLVATLTVGTLDSVMFLQHVLNVWDTHCNQMRFVRDIFLYLDRHPVVMTSPAKSLIFMGRQIFCQALQTSPGVLNKLVDGLLEQIERERQGETINRPMVRGLTSMLEALGLYGSEFEPKFLKTTNEFYQAEGARLVHETDVPRFLRHIESRLREENDRLVAYLYHGTRRALISAVETQLLSAHCGSILERGFASLMDGDRQEDLAKMFQLFGRVEAQSSMAKAFLAYMKTKGDSIVADPNNDKELVELLLAFKDKVDRMLTEAFHTHLEFKKAIKDAFEWFINNRQNKPAELIAKFVDVKLRTGNKGVSEAEIEAELDKVMVLFRAINGKDIFEAFYKKDLGKRLLLGKSASADLERVMLSKLKTECGAAFTHKLEGMFKDITVSKDLDTAFQAWPTFRSLEWPTEIYVHVLTTTHWPAYPVIKVNLPVEFSRPQDIYQQFYNSRFNGRRLTWQHSLAHCLLRAQFPGGKKELQVSLIQSVVLLLFNHHEELSLRAIAETTGLEDDLLRRTLQSLACGPVRVLSKSTDDKDITDADVFQFNTDFKSKLFRIKINSIQVKETQQEAEETNERVFRDRQYQIDAAVVRIMKTRNSLTHAVLVSELLQHLKFHVEPAQIKKRIESLIEREYLERDESKPNVYNYVA